MAAGLWFWVYLRKRTLLVALSSGIAHQELGSLTRLSSPTSSLLNYKFLGIRSARPGQPSLHARSSVNRKAPVTFLLSINYMRALHRQEKIHIVLQREPLYRGQQELIVLLASEQGNPDICKICYR